MVGIKTDGGAKTNEIPGGSENAVKDAESALADMPADWVVNTAGGPPKKPAVGGSTRMTGSSSSTNGPSASGATSSTNSTESLRLQGGDPELPDDDGHDVPDGGVESFAGTAELITGGGTASPDELIMCLMDYLKDVAKEKRETKEFKQLAGAATLAAKSAQLDKQTEAITKGQEEAGRKADIAMEAATTGMIIGIVQGVVQIGAAVASYAGSSASASAESATPNAPEAAKFAGAGYNLAGSLMTAGSTLLGALNTYMQGSAQAEQLRVDEHSLAAEAKKQANELQKVVNKAEKDETKLDDDLKLVQDHYTAIKDAIKKTIEQASESFKAGQALGRG